MTTDEAKKTRMEVLEETVATVIERLDELDKKVATIEKTGGGKPKGLFGGQRERKAMKDTQTGIVYVSKAALGKALATEADTTEDDHFAFYKLDSKFPDRFVEATADEKKKVEDEEAAKREKEQQEEQARLEAQAAEAAKKEADEEAAKAGQGKKTGGDKK